MQALFDAADGQVEEIRSRGRKGALAAQRDAALLKTVYAFGLRRREAWGLDLADLRHNPRARQFAGYGAVFVALTTVTNPTNVVTWLGKSRSAQLLGRLARTGDPITHDQGCQWPTENTAHSE